MEIVVERQVLQVLEIVGVVIVVATFVSVFALTWRLARRWTRA